MLVASGPGVTNLKDYTTHTDEKSIQITMSQGDTLPTAKCQVFDLTNSFTITDETDFLVIDEYDSNGWPTVNLITNPIFAGPYTSGVAASWAALYTGAGTSYASGTHFIYGSTSQAFSLTNVASGRSVGVNQIITLPTDELQHPIVQYHCALSFWVYQSTAVTGATTQIEIDWYDSTSTFISSTTEVISNSFLVTGEWKRFNVIGKPPSNAAFAYLYFLCHTTSGTNTGALTITAAQFEAATFENVQAMNYNPYIENLFFNYHGTSGLCDGYSQNPLTGATFSAVTSPVLNTNAQQITLSNATFPGSANMEQTASISIYGVYTVSMEYQIPSVLIGCSASLGVVFFDSLGNPLLTLKALSGLVPTGVWNSLSIRFGPGTGNVAPINTSYVGFQFGVDTSAATNSGTVYIGEASILADPIQQQLPNANLTAFEAGLYPTPYCDKNQAGCHFDKGITNLAYRQLRFFGGYIRTTSFDYFESPERRIDIDAVGYGIILQESPANLLVRNMADSAVIAFAFQYGASQGFLTGIDYTTFVQSISQIDSLTWNWADTKQVLTDVSNLTIADYWVDEYKFLHYQPSLATPSPYNFSDTPNLTTTFPMFGWRFDNDSTQSVTTKVFEGGNVVSLPVTQNFHGVSTTLNASLTQGTTYTSITVVATTTSVQAGTIVTLNNGTTTQDVTVNTDAISGATTLLVNSFVADANFVATNTVIAFSYLLNAGTAIYQVTNATVNAVTQSVGISGVNTFAQGYNALVDTNAAIISFNTAPPNGQAVVIIYTYLAPVIVRVRNGGAETEFGPIRRRIHHHQQDTSITSITTAIVRSQSELAQYSKARPIGKIVSISPPAPLGVHLTPGMSVQVTHASSGLTAATFQIQRMTISYFGPGRIKYELDVGFYRLDLAMLVYQGRQQLIQTSVDTQGTVITDVLSLNDGWTLTDNLVPPTIINVGSWAPPTTSDWDSTSFSWG